MITVWDFGGVKFAWLQDGDWETIADVDFYGSDGNHSIAKSTLIYNPEYLEDTNVDREIVCELLGYRAELTVELMNIMSNDGSSIANFLESLNSNMGTYELGCWVNVDTSGDGGVFVGYLKLDSGISIQDLYDIEIGQKLDLKFRSKKLIQQIPTVTSDTTTETLKFNTDDAYFNAEEAEVKTTN